MAPAGISRSAASMLLHDHSAEISSSILPACCGKVGGPRHHDLHAGFWTAGIEALGTRIVGIRIKANRLRLPGGVDDGEGLRRLPEIVADRALMMRDGQRDRSLPPDHQRLINRFFQFFEVIAMMGTIKPTMQLDGLHQGKISSVGAATALG